MTYNRGQLILPGLFSNPINPLPGQVWYRMDAGVIAFFDGIQGRMIYINRNNNVITVCSRGISNGLSKLYNDGFDFGPDTMLNATLPNQYGPPYTKTSGLLEAVNYQQKNGGKIQMTAGRFVISPDTPLTQVTTSIVIGVPEYAVIPIYGGYNLVKVFKISGIAGDTSSDTDVQTDYLNNTVDGQPD